jgi:hypothetical protein
MGISSISAPPAPKPVEWKEEVVTHKTEAVCSKQPDPKKSTEFSSNLKRKQLLYLACPYMADKDYIRRERVASANLTAATLFAKGYNVFSPLSHGEGWSSLVPIDKASHQRWMELDIKILAACQVLLILPLDGWTTSAGVCEEIMYARKNSIEVFVLGKKPLAIAGSKFAAFDLETDTWGAGE